MPRAEFSPIPQKPQPFLRQDTGFSSGGLLRQDTPQDSTSIETSPPHEFTRETLEYLNHSSNADSRRTRWQKAYEERKITAIRKCPDSRVMTPNPTSEITIDYIGAGGNVKDSILMLPAISNKVIMGHMALSKFRLGEEMPKGCGGAEAKLKQIEQVRNGNASKPGEKIQGLDFYIREHIAHPDPIVNAVLFAMLAAGNNPRGVPIMATAQDHETLRTFPIAALVRVGTDVDIIMHDNLRRYLFGNAPYNPRMIYADGLPTISIGRLPDESAEYIQSCEQMAEEMLQKYPDLPRRQAHQREPIIAINTDLRHKGVMLPGYGDEPGGVFEMFTPKNRTDKGIITPPKALITSLRQIEYPFKTHLANAEDPEGDFSGSHTVWINHDGDYDVAEGVGKALVGRQLTHRWGGRIIVSSSVNGKIVKTGEL